MTRRTTTTTTPIVVGIAGPSGAGKTWAAERIRDRLTKADGGKVVSVAVLKLDDYYLGCDPDEAAHFDFDRPQALELSLLVEHVRALKAGAAVEKPTYDFARHARRAERVRVRPADVVVVEGLFALADDALAKELDVKAYVDERESVCLKRRILRDVEHRGRPFTDALDHLDAINRGYDLYVEPSQRRADVVGDADLVVGRIEALVRAEMEMQEEQEEREVPTPVHPPVE